MAVHQNERVNINIEQNNEEDSDAEVAWLEVAALQRELSLSQRPICCFACTSIEMLLASLCSIWVLFSLFEGTAGFNVKRYEAMLSYAISFCVFSGLISERSKLLTIGIVLCAIALLWNLVSIHVLTKIFQDPGSKLSGEPTLFLVEFWPDLQVFFKQMAFSDFHAFFALYLIKIGYISAVLVTAVQLNNVKKIERRLNKKRQRLGEMLNARMHRDYFTRNQLIYGHQGQFSEHTARSPSVVATESIVSFPLDLFNMDAALSTAVEEVVHNHPPSSFVAGPV